MNPRTTASHPTTRLPYDIDPMARVVLFDGVCKVCNAWVKFLVQRDPEAALKLASVQSPAGQAILAWCGLPIDRFDTMVFVDRGRAFIKSEAFLRIIRLLPWPWPLLGLGVAIPRPLRDWLYELVAVNRFVLFGRSDSCLFPTPQLQKHFLA